MEQTINGDMIAETYWSLAEYAAEADKRGTRSREDANNAAPGIMARRFIV